MSLAAIIRRIERKTKETINEIDNKYLSYSWYNKDFEKYVESYVRRHIEILKEGKLLTQEERNEDKLYSRIRQDYTYNYCPAHLNYDWLTKKNQERYFWLRLDIDEALDDAYYLFNDKK